MAGFSIDLNNRNPILFDSKILEEASISSKLNLDKTMAEDFAKYAEANPDLAPDAALIGYTSNADRTVITEINKEIEQLNANRLGSYLGQDGEDSFFKATSRLAVDVLFSLGEGFLNLTSYGTRDFTEATTGNLGLEWTDATNKNFFEGIYANTALGAKVAQYLETGEWPGGTGWWFTDPTSDHESFKESLRKEYFGAVTDEFGNEEAYSIGLNVGLGFSRDFNSASFQIAKGLTDAAIMLNPYALPTSVVRAGKLVFTPASNAIRGVKKAASARAAFNVRAEELAKELNISVDDAKLIVKGEMVLPSQQNIDEIIDAEIIDSDIAYAYTDKNIIEVEAIEDGVLAIGAKLSENPNPADTLINRSIERETVESSEIALGAKERKSKATQKKTKEEKEIKRTNSLVKEHDAAVVAVKEVDSGTPLTPKIKFKKPVPLKFEELATVLDEQPVALRPVIAQEILNSTNVSPEELLIAFKYSDGNIFTNNTIEVPTESGTIRVDKNLHAFVSHPSFEESLIPDFIDEITEGMRRRGLTQDQIDDEIVNLEDDLDILYQVIGKEADISNSARPMSLDSAEKEIRLRQSPNYEPKPVNKVLKDEAEKLQSEPVRTYVDDVLDIFNGNVEQFVAKTQKLIYEASDETIDRILDEDILLNMSQVGPAVVRAILVRPSLTSEQAVKLWSKLRTSSLNVETYAEDAAYLFRAPQTPESTKQEIFDSLINVYNNNPGVFDGLDIIIVDEFIDQAKALKLMQTVRKSVIENNKRFAAESRKEAPAPAPGKLEKVGTDEDGDPIFEQKVGQVITRKNANQAKNDYAYKMLGIMLAKFDDLTPEIITDLFESQMYRLQAFQYVIVKNTEDVTAVLQKQGFKGGKYAAVSADITEINGRLAPFLQAIGGPYPTRMVDGKQVNPTMAQINAYNQRLVTSIVDFADTLKADVLNDSKALKKIITDQFGFKLTNDSIDVVTTLLHTARNLRQLEKTTLKDKLLQLKKKSELTPVILKAEEEATIVDLFESGVRKDFVTPEAASKQEFSVFGLRQGAIRLATLNPESSNDTILQYWNNRINDALDATELATLIDESIPGNIQIIGKLTEEESVEFVNNFNDKIFESASRMYNESLFEIPVEEFEQNVLERLAFLAGQTTNLDFKKAVKEYLEFNNYWGDLRNIDPKLNTANAVKRYSEAKSFDNNRFAELATQPAFTPENLLEIIKNNSNPLAVQGFKDGIIPFIKNGKVTEETVKEIFNLDTATNIKVGTIFLDYTSEILGNIEFKNFNDVMSILLNTAKQNNIPIDIVGRNNINNLTTENLNLLSELNPESFYGNIPLHADASTVKRIIRSKIARGFKVDVNELAHPAIIEEYYKAEDLEVFSIMLNMETDLAVSKLDIENVFNAYGVEPEDWARYIEYGKGINANDVVHEQVKKLAQAIENAPADELGDAPTLRGFSARFTDFKVIINGTGKTADTGYMVARPANQVAIKVANNDDAIIALDEFYKKYKELLEKEPDVYVGGWVDSDTGIMYIDISDHIENLDVAMELGKLRDQFAVWKIHDTTVGDNGLPLYNGKEITLEGTTGGRNAKVGSELNPREIYGKDVSPKYRKDISSESDQAGTRTPEGDSQEVSDQVPVASELPPSDARGTEEVLPSSGAGARFTADSSGAVSETGRVPDRDYLTPAEIRAKVKAAEIAKIKTIRGAKTEKEFKDGVKANLEKKELIIREADAEIVAADTNLSSYNEGVESAKASIAARVNEMDPSEQAALNEAGATVSPNGSVRFTEAQADLAARLDGPIFRPIIEAIARMGSIHDIDRLTNRQFDFNLLKRLADEGTTPDNVKAILEDAIGDGSLRADVVTAMNPRTAAAVGAATKGHAGAVAQETMDTNFVQIVLDEIFGKGSKTALRTYGFTSVSKSPYHHTVNIFDAASVARHFQDVIDWSFRTSKVRVTKKGIRSQIAIQRKADELIEKMYRAETVEERIRLRRESGLLLAEELVKDLNLTPKQTEQVMALFKTSTREIDDEALQLARDYNIATKEGDLFAGSDMDPTLVMRVNQLANTWIMWDPQEIRNITGTIGFAFAKYNGTPPPEFFNAFRNVVDSTWRVLHLARFAFTMRNVLLDITVRNYAAGLPNIITNPREAIAMIFSDESGNLFQKLMSDLDPYTEDLIGNPLKMSMKNPEYDEILANRPGYEHYIDKGNSWVDPQQLTDGLSGATYRDNLFVKVGPNEKAFTRSWSRNLVGAMYDPIMREVLLVSMGKRSKGLATFMKENNLTDTQEALIDYILKGDSNVSKEWARFIESNKIAGKMKDAPTKRDIRRNAVAEQAADRDGLREILFSEQGSYAVELRRLTSNYDADVMVKVEELLASKVGKRSTGEMRNNAEKELIKVLEESRVKQGDNWESFNTNARFGDVEPPRLKSYFGKQFNRFVDAQFRWSGYAEKATGYDISYRIRYVESIAELAPLLRKEDRGKLIEYAQKLINKGVQLPNGKTSPVSKRALKQANAILDTIKKADNIDGALDFKQFQLAVDSAATTKTRNLYYKALDQSQFWLASRLFIPFGASWADGMQKLTRAPFINNRVPAILQAAVTYQYLLDPRSDWLSDLFQTEEPPKDSGYIWRDPYSGEHMFVAPIIPEVMNRIIAAGASVMTEGRVKPQDDLFTGAMRVADLNMFTGQTQDISALFGQEPKSVVLPLPGAGYVLQVANGMLKSFPAYREHFEWLDNYIQPYKNADPDKSIVEDFVPSWLRKLLASVTPNEFSKTLTPYYVPAYTALVSTGQYTDQYGMITPEMEKALEADAMAIAKLDSFVSALQQFIGPSVIKQIWKTIGPDDMHIYQHMLVQERVALTKEFNGDMTKAYTVLAEKYGWNNILAATPKTTALTYGSQEAYRAGNKFPELFDKAPDVFPLLFPGDTLSPEITAKMRSAGQGEQQRLDERLDYLESMVWKVQKNNLESQMVSRGYSQKQISFALDAMKANHFIGGEVARPPQSESELLGKKMAQLESVLFDPRLDDNAVAITARQALQARKAAMAKVDARGIEGINDQKNTDIQQALYSVYQQLLESNPQALDIISRTFIYELEID